MGKKVDGMDSIGLMLDGMPMTRYQTCFCCHTVRDCTGCCNTCIEKCTLWHQCELPLKPDSTWLNSIITVISPDYWIYPNNKGRER